MMPIHSSDAANMQPVSGRPDPPTVSRASVRGDGGAVRAAGSQQNLHPHFDAAAVGGHGRSAAAD